MREEGRAEEGQGVLGVEGVLEALVEGLLGLVGGDGLVASMFGLGGALGLLAELGLEGVELGDRSLGLGLALIALGGVRKRKMRGGGRREGRRRGEEEVQS